MLGFELLSKKIHNKQMNRDEMNFCSSNRVSKKSYDQTTMNTTYRFQPGLTCSTRRADAAKDIVC